MNLRFEVIMLKTKTGKSYKVISEESGINYTTLIKFVEGYRKNLSKANTEKLVTYLSSIKTIKGDE